MARIAAVAVAEAWEVLVEGASAEVEVEGFGAVVAGVKGTVGRFLMRR